MKKQLLLILLIFSFTCSFSQEVRRKNYDTKKLEGTWVATSGSKSYEVTIVKKVLSDEDVDSLFEMVLGSIKYIENNKIIKKVDLDGANSPLVLFYRGKDHNFTARYKEDDNGKKIFGRACFDVNADGKTARWYNLYETNDWGYKPKKDKFDIPKELTFKKK